MKRAREEDKSRITQEQLMQTRCFVRQGLRHVDPYWHTFTLNGLFVRVFFLFGSQRFTRASVKHRMLGKALLESMLAEFPMYTRQYFEGAIADGRVAVSGRRVEPGYALRGHDLIEHRVHRHEPPVTAERPSIV